MNDDLVDALCALEYSITMPEVLAARRAARAAQTEAALARLRLRQHTPLHTSQIHAMHNAHAHALEQKRYADDCESRLQETLSGKWDRWLKGPGHG